MQFFTVPEVALLDRSEPKFWDAISPSVDETEVNHIKSSIAVRHCCFQWYKSSSTSVLNRYTESHNGIDLR